jgi:ribosomal protein L37E
MHLFLFYILLYSTPFVIQPGTKELELRMVDMEFYEDKTKKITFNEVRKSEFQFRFNKDLTYVPQDYVTSHAYWVKVDFEIPEGTESYLVEFFDQTIDSLTVYLRHESTVDFTKFEMGDMLPFQKKQIAHKNFELQLTTVGKYTMYFRVVSHEYADIRLAIRSYGWFVKYAVAEYFLYGIFYGMILIISLYNILIFTAIREEKYLYYTFYILSVGFFAVSVDGIGYQYIWQNSPQWNQIAHGVGLFLLIFFAILFSRKFLSLSIRSPKMDKLLLLVLGLRILWFLYALLINQAVFQYRNIELIPLIIIFIGSISTYQRGYKPARFFIVAFGFLFLGFILKAMLMLNVIPFYIISYYSLHICFVFEMLFLSFALSDRVRILKETRDKAHKRIILQHEQSGKLKDKMNEILEQQVAERTTELLDKNKLLQTQKLEISEINSLLDLDNFRLRNNIITIQVERLQDKELTYQQFVSIFSDKNDCLAALGKLKWKTDYHCIRCENNKYSSGTLPHSRRCSKCGYQESPSVGTLFYGIKFPLEKAFYILYDSLNKEQYSLSELSVILSVRINTVSNFKKQILALTESEKSQLKEIFRNIEYASTTD